jgi:hypothetical protein
MADNMKNISWVERLTLTLILMLTISINIFSQVSDKIINVQTDQPIEKKPILLTADLSPNFIFNKIEFAYRVFGESEFTRLEMVITNNKASITIPADKVIPPYIEYYLLIYIKDAAEPETYPIENPLEHPMKLVINPEEIPTNEVVWLSPDNDEPSTPEDLLIAFSIPETDTTIDIAATKIFLNDNDVTQFAVRSEDLFVVKPENITPPPAEGTHWLRVEIFGKNGKQLKLLSRKFSVKQIGEAGIAFTELTYRGSVQLDTRNENIGGTHNSYNTGSVNASATYTDYKVLGSMYITSEEKSDRQPQNRYFIGAESPWLKIGYGDSYPMYPSLIMSGKRIRGLTSSLTLGFFNIDFAYGETIRKIQSNVTIIDSTQMGLDSSKIYIQPDSNTYAIMNRRGEFTRNLFFIRPSFGSGESYQLGFSVLKSKDDKNSIKYGLEPKENLVIGSDLLLAFDQRRIELTAQAGFSVTNNDISKGNIKDDQIDTLFKDNSDQVRKIRDIFSKIITINENVVPLNLKGLTTLSYEGALNLNYFDNFFRLSYIRRGKGYESFGQSYLRTNVSGFNVTDRFRMLSNKLFLSLGFEKLSDNVGDLESFTTKFTTISTTASYYPQQDLPNVTVGYVYASAINNLAHDSSSAFDDYTNRIFFQTGYNFVYLEKQNVVFGISTSNRNDRTDRDWDTKNFSLSLALNTYYSFPLQTSLNLSFNNSSTRGAKWNYTNLALTGYYKLLDDRLYLNAGMRSTFGDVKRNVFDLGAQYTIIQNLNVLGQVSLYSYKSANSESVWSLMLRYNI